MLQVQDQSGNTEGFADGTDFNNEYTYDANGNLTQDQNKGISNIVYNILNLTGRVTINNQTVSYIYDATGNKRQTVAPNGTTIYEGSFEYFNGTLQRIGLEEGQLIRNSDATYTVHYYLKDHLGNVRTVLGINEATTPLSTTVLQETDYYPFGLPMVRSGNDNNKYRFLGRESQPETGWVDLMKRMYDPPTGRFMSVDPKPDEGDQESLSTYQYGLNNPVLLSDPNGDCVKCLEAIKKWLSAPISPLAQETGKAYMQSMTGRDITPTTRGEFMLASIGFASQRFGGSLPGSNKIRIPQGGRNKSGGDNSTPVTVKIGESENINVGSNSTRITQFKCPAPARRNHLQLEKIS